MSAEREARLARIAAAYPEAAAEAREAGKPPRWAVAPGRSLTLDGVYRFSIAPNDYTGLGAAELDAMAYYVAALLNARPADDWSRFFAAYMAAPLGTVPTLESAR